MGAEGTGWRPRSHRCTATHVKHKGRRTHAAARRVSKALETRHRGPDWGDTLRHVPPALPPHLPARPILSPNFCLAQIP